MNIMYMKIKKIWVKIIKNIMMKLENTVIQLFLIYTTKSEKNKYRFYRSKLYFAL